MSYNSSLTDAQLRASPVAVLLSGTSNVAIVAGTAAIGTAGTASADVITVQGIASGTALPVTGTVAATQSGAWNITNITGTVSLPTGAATDAVLTGGTQRTKLTDGTNNVAVTDGTVAANETLTDRLKVAAALRVLDTTQTTGAQLLAARGDQTSGLWVNVKTGIVRQAFSTQAEQSLTEQMTQMNGTLRVMTHLLTQILAVSRGRTDPAIGDEADVLLAEFLNPASDLLNMIN